jgi:hypothetical protein
MNHENAVSNLFSDIASMVGDIIALIADWGQAAAMVADIVVIVAQGLLIGGDIASLNGNAPAWLTTIMHWGQIIIGGFNAIKGFISVFGAVNALLDSWSAAKGTFTLAEDEFKDSMTSGLGSLMSGGSGLAQSIGALNENDLSPQDARSLCFQYHLDGCQ